MKTKTLIKMYKQSIGLFPKKYLSFLFSVFFFFSCSSDYIDPLDNTVDGNSDPNPTQIASSGSFVYAPTPLGTFGTSPQTFGIRNDKKLSDYEAIATNMAPYNTDEFPDFGSVVCIIIEDGKFEYIGTGVLINSQWIITAAHNFIEPEKSKKLPALSAINILVGNDPNNPSKTLKVSQVIVHPQWTISDGGFEKGTDLALVKLSSPITNITPANLNLDINGEKDKAYIWTCGFGDYSGQAGQNKDDYSKKHAMVNVLDRIVNGLSSSVGGVNYNGGLLAFDFDAPDGKYNTLGDNIVNVQEYDLGKGNSSPEALEMEGGTIEGDSGSPIFVKINGVWKVCGLLHGGIDNVASGVKDSSYGDISVYTRTASAASWIQSVIN
ncbi:trypsin-like serine protease [Lacihabitans sp. LS3-19]|uniref:S1 family peptidase n=1 Tax=Lacihabitans sp. LS3-19 TaxID=2487335 RepID=UPI0020CC0231|nr:trypsin-like serine protease [Lacihabitans sp. LS3-19]